MLVILKFTMVLFVLKVQKEKIFLMKKQNAIFKENLNDLVFKIKKFPGILLTIYSLKQPHTNIISI